MADGPTNSLSPALALSLRGRWAAALVLLIVAVPLILLAFRSEGLDFRAFYVAAKASAAHLDPYADNRRFGEQFADAATESGISRWIYPPPALFYVAPLGLLSFAAAKMLFELISIAGLGWVLIYVGPRFEIHPIWLLLAGISLPVIACVQRGQIDLLILLCVVMAYRFSDRYWSGLPLGIAISVKIFPAALLLWWLLERQFKAVATALGFTAVISLLAAGHFGISSYFSFLHNLTTLHSQASSGSSVVSAPGHWISFSPGFVGSYNNPLILFDNAGIFVGLALTVLAAVLLRFKRVAPEVGFFSMALISQLMNTTLWAMGVVMYIPICLIAIGRLRSTVFVLLFLIPLYLPSQIRVFGVTPRLVLALVLIAWLATRTEASRTSISATTYA
jgi:Glycosyltransferase family 87